MSDQTVKSRARETAKLAIRRGLSRLNLDVAKDPYTHRLVRTLESRGIDTVLDIGANVGQYSTQLRFSGYTGRIVSVEPLDGAFAELSKRAARDPLWRVIQGGVGPDGETAQINVAANSFSSSILPMTDAHLTAAPGSGYIATQDITLRSVASLVEEAGADPARTLLKVDTQGFERQVLDSAGPLVDAFAAVQLELSFVELYEGQLLYDDLVTRLAKSGLTLWSFEPGISGEDGRLLQCDGLFVRTDA